MAGVSVGAAAFEGFRVIGRHPLAVLAWAAVLFVLTFLPLMASVALVAPSLEEMIRQIAAESDEGALEAAMAMQARMMALNPLTMLASFVARVLVMCAVFRAVLAPQDKRFGYLRVGAAELWTGLVTACLAVMFAIVAIFGVVGMGVVAIASGALTDQTGGEWAVLALVAGVLLAVVWLALRFSMALPMSFEQRTFRLFESWALTRGLTLRLVLLMLLVLLIVILLEIAVAALAIGGGMALLAGRPIDEGALLAFFSRPMEAWLRQLAPWAVAVGVVGSLLGAALSAIVIAPWAAVWRQVAPREAAA